MGYDRIDRIDRIDRVDTVDTADTGDTGNTWQYSIDYRYSRYRGYCRLTNKQIDAYIET